MFVLDASMTLAWTFEDETTQQSRQVARRALAEGVAVPQHWAHEVSNGLIQGERRKRTALDQTAAFLARLEDIPIQVEVLEPERVFHSLVPLSRAFRLSVYDAGYLELAQRLGLPLATLDGPLGAAAQSIGVQTIGAGEG